MTSGKEMKTKMNCLICCKQARANDRKKLLDCKDLMLGFWSIWNAL